jgi:hypothetical protein
MTTPTTTKLPMPAARRRRGALVLTLATTAALLTATSRPARAELLTGLDAAFTMDALIIAGGLVAVGGNAVDLARGKPSRGFMYAGFILGTVNIAAGLVTVFFGGDPITKTGTNVCADSYKNDANMMPLMYSCGPPTPQIQYGLGVAQTLVGVADWALSIRNAVLWHRARLAEAGSLAPTPPPPPSPAQAVLRSLRVAPLLSRDLSGQAMYGLTVGLRGL